MRRIAILAAMTAALAVGSAPAAGLLIPTEKQLPPLAMLNHHVSVAIEDQAAVTTFEQTFRNHTDRQLEATYVFPVPKGASVKKLTMWVDGKETPGELLESDKARKIYTDIVSRTQDPALLEYMGNDILKLRVFPILPKSDQKVKISYTSVAPSDAGVVEYRYPFKTDGKAVATLEKFTMTVKLRSQHAIQNIYSPSHGITINRPNDKEATVGFEKDQALLDRDFQLFYTTSTKDVGVTAVAHRPSSGQPGHFMLLVAPRAELSKTQQAPRDMVFVLDTSGSMRGKRLTQAKAAMKYCLQNLNANDRFNMVHFATAVNVYEDKLQDASADSLERGKRWVDSLEATGGTAINDALAKALDLNPNDKTRTYTIVFFTDGRPTVGETNTDRILQNAAKRNSSNVRLFTFGVGDDVNASMLDTLADQSRAVSTYVRESEDIEAKVSSLYGKISNPVLANLKLTTEGGDVRFSEIYPQQLPDLFHGSQLVVFGRYTGSGHVAVKVTGNVGAETREFVYETTFADKTGDDKAFVEDLWARRKVGFLLDQIRLNGEKKELVDEVVLLAKRYGITTPYTSYLVVPDSVAIAPGPNPRPVPLPVPVGGGLPNVRFNVPGASAAGGPMAPPTATTAADGKAIPVADAAKLLQAKAGEGGQGRLAQLSKDLAKADREVRDLYNGARSKDEKNEAEAAGKSLEALRSAYELNRQAGVELRRGTYYNTQQGSFGVNLSFNNQALRNQSQIAQSATRRVGDRNCLEVGGVWIDEAFSADLKTVSVKAQSAAYFRILERHPSTLNVLRIGNHVVWVTPSRTALVIDPAHGAETLTDAEIDALFVAAPAKK